MFCPLCKAEYREGFTTCADCSVPLVAEIPREEEPQLVEVFQTLDQSEILIIKSVLEEEGIPYHFSGDFFRMSGILVSPARLLVPADSRPRVLAIIKGLQIGA